MLLAKKVFTASSVEFQWADGESTIITPDMFSDEIQQIAMLKGFGHALGDAYAGSGGDLNVAKEMFEAKLQTLIHGNWNAAGGSGATGGVWAEAIAKATGEDLETVIAKWQEMDDATRKAVKAHPDVKQAKLEIDLAKAKAKAADAPKLEI